MKLSEIKNIKLFQKGYSFNLLISSWFFGILIGLPGLVPAQINYSNTKFCPTDPPSIFTSIATEYGPLSPGTGACGFKAGMYDPTYYAAIASSPTDDYQGGVACGACAAVSDLTDNSAITVMIVDKCPSCSTANQIDLGLQAWNAMTGNAPGGIRNIAWSLVPCPLDEPRVNGTG